MNAITPSSFTQFLIDATPLYEEAVKREVKERDAADKIESIIELSECPCDPRRRHERLGQKVAVV